MALYAFDGRWNEDEADSTVAEKASARVMAARRV